MLSLDVKNRWNSTYLMLKKALKYQHGLKRYKLGDTSISLPMKNGEELALSLSS